MSINITGKRRFVSGAGYLGLTLGLFGISAAALLCGCVVRQENSREEARK